MNKRYYWLKLKKDFFKGRKMKKLRKIAGGPIYTIIYLKLQLLCLDSDGVIEFEGIEDNLVDELALEIDETSEDVGVTLSLLKKWGLVEMKEDDIFLPEVLENTGKETASTIRSRKSRANKKLETENCNLLQCNRNATNCNTEKVGKSPGYINDIEKERNNFPKKEIGEKIIEALKITPKDVEAIKIYEDYKKTPERIQEEVGLLENEIKEMNKNTEKLEEYVKNWKTGDNVYKLKDGVSHFILSYYDIGANKKVLYSFKNSTKKSNKRKTSEKIPVYNNINVKSNKVFYLDIVDDYSISLESNHPNLIAVKMLDDSMDRKIPENSYVLIEERSELSDGNIGFFSIKDEPYIRQLKIFGNTYVLKSFNPKYEDIKIEKKEELNIIGKVIEYKMKL